MIDIINFSEHQKFLSIDEIISTIQRTTNHNFDVEINEWESDSYVLIIDIFYQYEPIQTLQFYLNGGEWVYGGSI